MKRIFLEKYFPASRGANIRKEIYGIKKHMGESLHEYWERFKNLCSSCLQYQISENLLIQYCYEGLLPHDRSMVDAASGRVFVDKTPHDARNLIENMTANSQQFGTNRRNGQNVKICGIFTAMRHATDMCPILQEESVEQVNATGGLPGPPQQNYDPYSNTYNPGWRDHPNLRYGNPAMNQPTPNVQQNNQAYRPPYPPQPQRPQIPTPGEFLENIVKDLATNTLNFQELKVREDVVQAPVKNEDVKESKVEENEIIQKDAPKGKFPPLSDYKPVPPFPLALKEFRKDEGIKELYDTFRRCEMADRSTIYPRGVIEDVLVKVDKLVFSADFYVFDMKNNDFNSPILLGRPFLKTSKSIIDVNNGTLTICESAVNNLDINDHLSQENKKVMNEDKLKKLLWGLTLNGSVKKIEELEQKNRRKEKQRKKPWKKDEVELLFRATALKNSSFEQLYYRAFEKRYSAMEQRFVSL
ncbi:uncharacterized protein [Henckelia pumila]|uniref:uncharacterized protein n=1 Tax=Henckelia pumila TaxID=405737 RepID=UPI003C6E1060